MFKKFFPVFSLGILAIAVLAVMQEVSAASNGKAAKISSTTSFFQTGIITSLDSEKQTFELTRNKNKSVKVTINAKTRINKGKKKIKFSDFSAGDRVQVSGVWNSKTRMARASTVRVTKAAVKAPVQVKEPAAPTPAAPKVGSTPTAPTPPATPSAPAPLPAGSIPQGEISNSVQ